MADTEIKFDNRKATKFFAGMSKKLGDVTERDKAYMGVVAAIMIKDVTKHFEKQQGPKSKWERWSDFYDKHMKAIGKGGNNILQDTGNLKLNIRETNIRKNPLGIELFNPAKTRSGFPYAKAHDEGLGDLPERQFMWLSRKAAESISKVTLAFIVKGK